MAKPTLQFRRLVTVLFVDVVESLALAGAIDAEALGRVLGRYFELVSGAIGRHGGTVEKFVGDAVMAAFGIPVSHEDDALRAARAAVDVRAGLAALNEQLRARTGLSLEVRIGLEAGELVATPTETRQRLVTGEAVGVAARLQQGAEPGEIVVGELAARLIVHAAGSSRSASSRSRASGSRCALTGSWSSRPRRPPSSAGSMRRSSAGSASSPRCGRRSSARSTAPRHASPSHRSGRPVWASRGSQRSSARGAGP